MLTDYNDIKEWLDTMGIEYYTIHDTGTVTVEDDVNLTGKGLTEIPVQFRTVYGYFSCSYNHLKSLKGSPQEVGWDVYCWGNEFKKAPKCNIIYPGSFIWETPASLRTPKI